MTSLQKSLEDEITGGRTSDNRSTAEQRAGYESKELAFRNSSVCNFIKTFKKKEFNYHASEVSIPFLKRK
jgi:hypothetical protein